jgi:hypothetical protein
VWLRHLAVVGGGVKNNFFLPFFLFSFLSSPLLSPFFSLKKMLQKGRLDSTRLGVLRLDLAKCTPWAHGVSTGFDCKLINSSTQASVAQLTER